MDSIKEELKALVGRLRAQVFAAKLDAAVVAQETAALAALRFAYDDRRGILFETG